MNRKGIGFTGTIRSGVGSKRGTLEVVRICDSNIVSIDGLHFLCSIPPRIIDKDIVCFCEI